MKIPGETSYWIFVDLGGDNPEYYIAPRWWVRNDIWENHTAYLSRYEQKHREQRQSDHHGIQVGRVAGWRDRWDVLGIL